MKKGKNSYHHGNLAISLLDAVDEIASQFGLEAVTLRACAKRVGVSPSSAFRHYADKRSLMTAFATRALNQLADAMYQASQQAQKQNDDAFFAVGLAYISFALDNPALFRAMWREETIYINDEKYIAATNRLQQYLQGGFAAAIADQDPHSFSTHELLAWSSVHGLANLFVEGAIGKTEERTQKIQIAQAMLETMKPVFTENK